MRLATNLLCVVLVPILGLLPMACNTEEPAEKMGQTISKGYEETKEVSRDTREEVKEGLNQTMDTLDKKIEALQARAKDAGGKVKEEYKDAIDTLDEKRKAAADDLKTLDDVAADQWDNAKDKAQDAVEALEKAYDDLASRIRN